MSELIVVGFCGQSTAAIVLQSLRDAGELEFNIEASAVVSRDEKGALSVHAPDDATTEKVAAGAAAAGAVAGGLVGVLIAAITANPVAGLAAWVTGSTFGGVAGLEAGKLGDAGVDDDFARQLGELLEVDSSAICFLFWDAAWDDAPGNGFEIIHQAGGKVLRTTLAAADEKELNALIGCN